MVINTNIAALNTYNQMSKNEKSLSSSLQKLSSGSKINSAADDPAGLAISQKMTTQVNGLDTASSNSQNGISLVQTADGALSETQSILQNMSELAVQAANDTNTTQDRTNTQAEITQLQSEIDRISNTTQFNTKNLLDGSMSGEVTSTTAAANINTSAAIDTGGAVASDAVGSNFTDLQDSNGNSLGITDGDKITVTYNMGGKTVSNSLVVGTSGTTVGDLANLLSSDGTGATPDATLTNGVGSDGSTTNGKLVITAAASGKDAAIDGLTLTVADSTGTVKAAASSALSSFTETTAATDLHATDGSATFQVGANSNQTVKLSIGDMSSSALGVSGVDVTTQAGANSAITAVNSAIQKVSSQRANLGAIQDRLNDTISNLTTESQNMTAASSQITDVDMASEMMQYTKYNILNQASQAMLSQANQLPQGALQLLK